MQKTYVFVSNVNFSQHDFYAVPGDTGVYDASKMTMTVYRGDELVKNFHLPLTSLKSMLELSWVKEEGAPDPAPKVEAAPKEEPEEIITFEEIENLDKMPDMEVAPMLTKKDLEPKEEVIEFEGDEEGEDVEHIAIEPEVAVQAGESEERIPLDGPAPKVDGRKLPKKSKKAEK